MQGWAASCLDCRKHEHRARLAALVHVCDLVLIGAVAAAVGASDPDDDIRKTMPVYSLEG